MVKTTTTNGTRRKERPLTITDIFRDVLKQISDKKIKPVAGTYLRFSGKSRKRFERYRYDRKQLKDLLGLQTTKCEACALGSLFCSLVLRKNDSVVGDHGSCIMRERMEAYTTPKQLAMIEAAFERSANPVSSVYWYDPDVMESTGFASKNGLRTDKAILRAICKNAIKNGGVFKP